jgi:NADH-ubiquinone oxidoreductase chain 5
MSAFFTNRVGDCILTLGLFTIIYLMGTLNYGIVYSLSGYFNKNIITIIGLCLLLGAMAKSSQLGLHV